ncbi:polyA polymerase reg subunit [Cedratvirus lausannensis]|uniref:PolyA polymerase reg subunit n=1 Tax=Cedratvirus lausannensis TaxID=2023205 RepID=A0A285Q131_9VIRU|nr:polyA polymerase reg subunit [Cedratvirus lausannensis]
MLKFVAAPNSKTMSANFELSDMHISSGRREYKKESKVKINFKSYLYPILHALSGLDTDNLILLSLGKQTSFIPHLLSTFPTLTIHCYYSRERIRHERVKNFTDFDDEKALYYSNKKVFLLINGCSSHPYRDIFTYFKSMMDNIPRWHRLIKPKRCLVRFFLPYPGEKIDYLSFLDGDILAMPFNTAPVCYLVPNGKMKKWDVREFDERMAHHVQVDRKKRFMVEEKEVSYDQAYALFIQKLYKSARQE